MPLFSKYLGSFLHKNSSWSFIFIMIGMDFFFRENNDTKVRILDYFL
jgi:hypothetical protein